MNSIAGILRVRESLYRQVVLSIVDMFNAGTYRECEEYMHSDVIYDDTFFSHPKHGITFIKEAIAYCHQIFPDLVLRLDNVLASGNTVMVDGWFQASATVPLFGMKPIGRSVKLRFFLMFQFFENKVITISALWDVYALLTQIGSVKRLPEAFP